MELFDGVVMEVRESDVFVVVVVVVVDVDVVG